nr:MAG TPA: Putative transferase, nesg, ydcK, Structural Genomics.38A [Caudoviricetes sp.]
MKKYELTAEFIEKWGKKLFRIKALISFGSVEAGELGGYIEKEDNLAHDGNAWVSGDARVSGNARVYGNARVSGDARVYGNAWVYGNARVYGDAEVSGNADYLLIGRIGSRFSFTTFFKNKDKGITVSCGCFLGTIAEFRAKVTDTHGNNKHAKIYNLAADMAELQILGEEHFDKLNTNKSESF